MLHTSFSVWLRLNSWVLPFLGWSTHVPTVPCPGTIELRKGLLNQYALIKAHEQQCTLGCFHSSWPTCGPVHVDSLITTHEANDFRRFIVLDLRVAMGLSEMSYVPQNQHFSMTTLATAHYSVKHNRMCGLHLHSSNPGVDTALTCYIW